MIALLGLLATLAAQDTLGGLSPRARAMIDEFPPPPVGEVAVDTRFNVREAYVGEQVELVTAAWFPRDLRERLRRQPTLRAPALSGLWNAPGADSPTLAETRRVGGRVYDLFIAHQTLFPLGSGDIEAPSAVLTYAVPSSVSFFAPEDRKSLASRPVTLRVRPVPERLVARLSNGPTARRMSVTWRTPTGTMHVGAPVSLELVVSGAGNVSLWPQAALEWPAGIRVYDEPTVERVRRVDGLVAGEKRFRFTIVPDSAGVLTLPPVRYPYFDPDQVDVRVASASSVPLVVRPALPQGDLTLPEPGTTLDVPLATRIVEQAGWLLGLLLLAPLPFVVRRRRGRSTRRIESTPSGDPLTELRRLAGPGVPLQPHTVEGVLRRRGVAAADARAVRAWLEAGARHRWGHAAPAPGDEPALGRALGRLRASARRAPLLVAALLGVTASLNGQLADGIERLRSGDAEGAERAFMAVTDRSPGAVGAWYDLGIARRLGGDDAGSAAAWLQGLAIAPRDGRLRAALAETPRVPPGVVARAPTIPLSRDELVLLALATWLLAVVLHRRRRIAGPLVALALACGGLAALRTLAASRPAVIVRGTVALRVSPTPAAPSQDAAATWDVGTVERRAGDWVLLALDRGPRGWLPRERVAALGRLD